MGHGLSGNGDQGEAPLRLYEQLAQQLTAQVDSGQLAAGERLPSVRQMSRQRGVSVATVLAAYQLLEDRGRIEARPQSGHYVRAVGAPGVLEPEPSRPTPAPSEVDTAGLVSLLLRDAADPQLLQLGVALPNAALLPTERLHRILARLARGTGGGYTDPRGVEPLRAQIASRLARLGLLVAPDEIIVTCGCQEALMIALRATCQAGDTVVLESPAYFNFFQAIETLGLRALELPTQPREGISLTALATVLGQHRVGACLLSTNYSNPLGATMPLAAKRELVDLLAEHGVPLIEDDIYGDLAHSGDRPPVAKGFDGDGGVILCSSFSKTISPGVRIGWMVPGRWLDRATHLKAVFSTATATLPQLAVAEFLATAGYDHHLRRIGRVYARLCAELAEAVGRCFPVGTRVSRPDGGFVLWLQCPDYVDARALHQAMRERGVTIAPGVMFGTQERYRHCLRLNAAFWSEPAAPAAVAEMGRLAAQMQSG